MHAKHETRDDDFISTFARDVLKRSELQMTAQWTQRYMSALERAIAQRLGVALCERLSDGDIQTTVREFLHGTPSADMQKALRERLGNESDFVQQELKQFSAEFLDAVHSH